MTSSLKAEVSPACDRATSSRSSGPVAVSGVSVGTVLDGAGLNSFTPFSRIYWNSLPSLFCFKTPAPLRAVFTHQLDDPVANLEEPLVKRAEAVGIDGAILAELHSPVDGGLDRLQGPLQVGDRLSDLVHIVIAERGGQLGAGNCHMGGELDRRRLVLEVLHLFVKLVDPHRQGKRGLIQRMH